DEARKGIVFFGGVSLSDGWLGDTWLFDGAKWAKPVLAKQPSPRSNGHFAYDRERGRVVAFGGWDGVPLAHTRLCEGSAGAAVKGPPPPAGPSGMMLCDDEGKRVVLFGGVGLEGSRDDTWIWDGSSWADVPGSSKPPPRDLALSAYDPISKRVVLYG